MLKISHFTNSTPWKIGTNSPQRVKNWYQYDRYFKLVKNAHVVKLYLAYMRIHHIDKIPPQILLHFAIDSNSSESCMTLFYNWHDSNRLHVNISFTVETSGTGVIIFKCKPITWAASQTETNTSLSFFIVNLWRFFNQFRKIFNQCCKETGSDPPV